MVWMHRDQIGFTHAIIRTQWYHESLQIKVGYFIFSHKFAVRPSAGIGRLFMTAMQLSAVQKLVQSLILQRKEVCGGVEGNVKYWFLYQYMRYQIRRYPINIYIYIILSKLVFKLFKICLYFYPGMHIDKFQQKSIICLYYFYFKKINFEHWNITLRPGSEIK